MQQITMTILALAISIGTSFSQDIILKKSGDEIAANSDEDSSVKAQQHATMNYTGKRAGVGWVSATTILFTPLIGIIPTLSCQSTKPSYQNLNFPDSALMEDDNYNIAYTQKAHQIKKKKIWKSFGISSGAWLLLILVL